MSVLARSFTVLYFTFWHHDCCIWKWSLLLNDIDVLRFLKNRFLSATWSPFFFERKKLLIISHSFLSRLPPLPIPLALPYTYFFTVAFGMFVIFVASLNCCHHCFSSLQLPLFLATTTVVLVLLTFQLNFNCLIKAFQYAFQYAVSSSGKWACYAQIYHDVFLFLQAMLSGLIFVILPALVYGGRCRKLACQIPQSLFVKDSDSIPSNPSLHASFLTEESSRAYRSC